MSTPLSMEWTLITEGKEKRVQPNDNLFEITFDGYKLFPMNERIEIKRHIRSDQIGSGEIEELILRKNTTICKYRLISLHSVN
ncbi:hypothetical protein GCM10010954_05440 [Halobacillus andaensis]|uniref:DUF2584 domain-containing protein n=1 Tax=Halobacillus andaensis TaxID=1176239 RepID=A0A917AZN7_HALAA|nr:DUF2584 family protein [Halobacillus andaensis]MBP2003333.1 hypothetical protein [Halobacillus andaensis]GGF09865.1 hypothetical protein GCM10010954_05440 [Halobacillus andaensis]